MTEDAGDAQSTLRCNAALVFLKESPMQNENANPPKKNEKFGITRAVENMRPTENT